MDQSSKNLRKSVYALFFIGLLGQAAFALYILLHLGVSGIQRDWKVWTDGMANGIMTGDPIGNTALIIHVVLAFFITVSGPLQFIPSLRKKASSFHKWNGRVYISIVVLTSIVALSLVWNRPIVIGGIVGAIAISGNAILIILCSFMTLRQALRGHFESHRRWAIRTYVVVLGVWFFRIGFGTWFLITGFTAPGVASDLTGWFDTSLYFASFLGPLAITELYLTIKKSDNVKAKKYLTILFIILCPLLIGGTIVTTMVFWL